MDNLIMNGGRMKNYKIDFDKRCCKIKINSRYTITKRIKGVSYFSLTIIKPHFPKHKATEELSDVNRCVNTLSYYSHQFIPNMFGILRYM